jgi:hypothetical protein
MRAGSHADHTTHFEMQNNSTIVRFMAADNASQWRRIGRHHASRSATIATPSRAHENEMLLLVRSVLHRRC